MKNKGIKVDSLAYDEVLLHKQLCSIGNRIYRERMKNGLTIAALADSSNLSTSCIYKVETSCNDVSLRTILKIACALDVPVDYLIEGNLEKEKEELLRETEELKQFVNTMCRMDKEVVGNLQELAERIAQTAKKTAEGQGNGE